MIAPPEPDFAALPRDRLARMHAAGMEVRECHRVLGKGGLNIVGEVLKGQGTFYQLDHYPKGDVFDRDSHSQYYYHAHRDGEHGHFHTFLRAPGMPAGLRPVLDAKGRDWPKGDQALAHIVAVSMDKIGFPLRLFTTNRWVTGETWHNATAMIAMLDRFEIDHAYPSWPTNRWITAMLRLFHPQIVALLEARDAGLDAHRAANPGVDVYEDKALEVISEVAIDVEGQISAIEAQLGA